MDSNPIVEKQLQLEKERRKQEDFRYPYRIVCVYLDSDNNDFPIIFEVRDYCNKNNLIFSARQYDYEKYEHDMFIKRLPAFQIYNKKDYQCCQYYDTNPVYEIQKFVWEYQDMIRKQQKRREKREKQWNTFVDTLKNTINLKNFKRKPKLDPSECLSHDRDSNI